MPRQIENSFQDWGNGESLWQRRKNVTHICKPLLHDPCVPRNLFEQSNHGGKGRIPASLLYNPCMPREVSQSFNNQARASSTGDPLFVRLIQSQVFERPAARKADSLSVTHHVYLRHSPMCLVPSCVQSTLFPAQYTASICIRELLECPAAYEAQFLSVTN